MAPFGSASVGLRGFRSGGRQSRISPAMVTPSDSCRPENDVGATLVVALFAFYQTGQVHARCKPGRPQGSPLQRAVLEDDDDKCCVCASGLSASSRHTPPYRRIIVTEFPQPPIVN